MPRQTFSPGGCSTSGTTRFHTAYRLPLFPQQRTSRDLGWTSAFDPQETLALPQNFEHWSLTTLREKVIKIGAKVVRHGRYITFQLAEVAVPRDLFRRILELIDGLRPKPMVRC